MHPRNLFASLGSLGSGLAALGALIGLVVPGNAFAQPSPIPTGGPAGEEEAKPEGIAEAAPKADALLTTTPTAGPPEDRRKKFEVFTIDGYQRVRADWFKNLNLGFSDVTDGTGGRILGGSPFPRPLGCDLAGGPCGDSINTSNTRLRLLPTIQLTETMAVHAQLDLFDNFVLGEGTIQRSDQTVVARRAWAEVSTPLGTFKVGRMPDHFGLGVVRNAGLWANTDYASWATLWQPQILANVGGNNPVGYALDNDYGDSIDRAMFTTMIPGTPLRAAVAYDWINQQFVTGLNGQATDADDADDLRGWMVSVANIDAPSAFADRVARGKLALNYGARVDRRTQDWDYLPRVSLDDPLQLVKVDNKTYTVMAWIKAGWKKILFEAEAATTIGSIANAATIGRDGELDIRSWGGVARGSSYAMDGKLNFGLELGVASGDSGEAVLQGRTNVNQIGPLPGPTDDTIKRFRFNPAYNIDLILFRELIGTVSNAIYGRPWISYDLTKSIRFTAQNVTSAAYNEVATPGNARWWGLEFDADLFYRTNGFTVGVAYGGFFPLAAMNHPENLLLNGSSTERVFGTTAQNAGDAENAHTLQALFALEF